MKTEIVRAESPITEVILRLTPEEAEDLTRVLWKSEDRSSSDLFCALPDELTKGAKEKWGFCG